MTTVNYLTDIISLLPEGQKYVCLSFLTDKDNNKSLSGLRFGGAFATYEEACNHAKHLQQSDQYFNVYVGESGKWLPFDPSPEQVQSSEYANQELNNMMKSYLENQEKAKLFHEQRKNEMVRKNILENLTNRKTNLEDAKNKLASSKGDEHRGLEETVKSIEENIKKMEDRKKELDEQLNLISKQIENFDMNKPFSGPKVVEDSGVLSV
jgi:DNA anti-recombination protein RmuC